MRLHHLDPIFNMVHLLTKLGVADVVHYISYPYVPIFSVGEVRAVDIDPKQYCVEAHFECR